MFALCSDITIGQFKRVKPHYVKVSTSMYDFVDKAVIQIPITARIVRAGEVITASAETAKLIEEGMQVNIDLGYNGILKNEFQGFVSRVNPKTPTEIECEGYSYQLRIRTYQHTFIKAKLLDILKYLVAGTDILLDTDRIPDFVFDKIVLDQHSGTEALDKLRKESNDTVRMFFTRNVLYAGLFYLKPKAVVKYRLGWNVIKDDNLKLRQAKNQDVVVKMISLKKDGTKSETTSGKHKNRVVSNANAGKVGETKVFKTHTITDQTSLQQMANAKLQQLKYDGYEGKITAFLQPYCEAGYTAALEDKRYPARGGNYIVESVEVTYGTSGARRIVGIGLKL
jgi:hypothetical protein